MGRLFVTTLEGKIYSCKHCRTHLALSDDVVSKTNRDYQTPIVYESFHCRHGKAYLFTKCECLHGRDGRENDDDWIAYSCRPFCVGCGSIVGWKYETAHEKHQKYKEGKSVLERFKVVGPDGSQYWMINEAQVSGSDADDA